MIVYKILLLGDTTVGKTAFILRFCENKFEEGSLATIGVDIKTKFLTRQDKKIQLQIWDTAGQERFRSIAKNSYKGAHGILLMYDISSAETFKHIKNWINDIKMKINKPLEQLALIVLGNKCDLPEEKRKVDEQDKIDFKNEYGLNIIEVSAKENKNINESMIELIDKMIELGVGTKKNDGDEQEGQKLDKAKTIKKTKKDNCCARKKSG
jgi:small GTP-binding protein